MGHTGNRPVEPAIAARTHSILAKTAASCRDHYPCMGRDRIFSGRCSAAEGSLSNVRITVVLTDMRTLHSAHSAWQVSMSDFRHPARQFIYSMTWCNLSILNLLQYTVWTIITPS